MRRPKGKGETKRKFSEEDFVANDVFGDVGCAFHEYAKRTFQLVVERVIKRNDFEVESGNCEKGLLYANLYYYLGTQAQT